VVVYDRLYRVNGVFEISAVCSKLRLKPFSKVQDRLADSLIWQLISEHIISGTQTVSVYVVFSYISSDFTSDMTSRE